MRISTLRKKVTQKLSQMKNSDAHRRDGRAIRSMAISWGMSKSLVGQASKDANDVSWENILKLAAHLDIEFSLQVETRPDDARTAGEAPESQLR